MTTPDHSYLCMWCTHLRENPANPEDEYCAAFPKGIPEDILENRVDHRMPVDGDNGIQFDPGEPGAEAAISRFTAEYFHG